MENDSEIATFEKIFLIFSNHQNVDYPLISTNFLFDVFWSFEDNSKELIFFYLNQNHKNLRSKISIDLTNLLKMHLNEDLDLEMIEAEINLIKSYKRSKSLIL